MTAHQKRRALSLIALTVVTSYAGVCGMCDEEPFRPQPFITITPPGPFALLVGGFVDLDASAVATGTSNPVIVWSSLNVSVATVSQDGLVNALEEGETIITAATNSTNGFITTSVTVEVVGPSGAAVVLDHDLAAAYQEGDTILLSRITHGRPADPDSCSTIHLHTAFGEPGILIDGDDGPFTDPNPSQCGFGRIIAISPVVGELRAAPMDHGPAH